MCWQLNISTPLHTYVHIHGKKNVTEQCAKLGLSRKLTKVIKDDIFGPAGLVYTKDRAEFVNKCDEFKAKWQQLESAEKVTPSFVQYFEKHKQEDIFDHMRVSISKEAGFGDQVVTTNPIESVNAVIKRWNNFQPTDAAAFLGDIKQCIDNQITNIQKAFFDLPGPYVVRPEFQQHIVYDYHQLSSQGRKNAQSKVEQLRVDSKRFKEVKSYRVTAPTSSDALNNSGDNNETLAEPISDDPFTKK